MKMIAQTKIKKSEDLLKAARAFSAPMINLITEKDFKKDETEIKKNADEKHLVVAFTADKGLCGSVNSSIVRAVRQNLNARISSGNTNFAILAFGEKGRGGLERSFGKYLSMAVSGISKPKNFNFKQVSAITSIFLDQKFDTAEFIYNRYVNKIKYETTKYPIVSAAKTNEILSQQYTTIEGGNDALQNLYEFRTAVTLFQVFADVNASEISARMTAMGNSSKAAADILNILRVAYNRRRQAKITTELIEIISGATSLNDKKDV